jgi:hypothetical protein
MAAKPASAVAIRRRDAVSSFAVRPPGQGEAASAHVTCVLAVLSVWVFGSVGRSASDWH